MTVCINIVHIGYRLGLPTVEVKSSEGVAEHGNTNSTSLWHYKGSRIAAHKVMLKEPKNYEAAIILISLSSR